MFDEILKLVKDHFGNHPEVGPAISAHQADDIHNEIANHINNALSANTAGTATAVVTPGTPTTPSGGGLSGIIGKMEESVAGGGPMVSAIEGGLVSSLASKFGLPPSITGAIAGMLPGFLQKFAHQKAKGQ